MPQEKIANTKPRFHLYNGGCPDMIELIDSMHELDRTLGDGTEVWNMHCVGFLFRESAEKVLAVLNHGHPSI